MLLRGTMVRHNLLIDEVTSLISVRKMYTLYAYVYIYSITWVSASICIATTLLSDVHWHGASDIELAYVWGPPMCKRTALRGISWRLFGVDNAEKCVLTLR